MTDPLIAEYRESIRLVQQRRDEIAAERDHYREALQCITDTPFSPEPGWRHWRLIAALALREGAAPPSSDGPSDDPARETAPLHGEGQRP